MTMRASILWTLPLSALILVGCGDKNKDDNQAKEDAGAKRVLATYKGGEITEQEINQEIKRIMSQGPDGQQAPITYDSLDPNLKQNVVNEFIAQRLLAKQAEEAELEKNKEVAAKIELATNRILAQELMVRKAAESVTEEKIRSVYDEQVKEYAKREEFRASHILVASEEEAKAILEQVKQDSTKFADIAREKSVDATKVRGGDLGYFFAEVMVPEFSNAVKVMKVGEIAGPVKTDFGWHVILLQDRRQAVPPAYEKARAHIERDLRQQAMRGFMDNLIKDANINYIDSSLLTKAQPAPQAANEAPAVDANKEAKTN